MGALVKAIYSFSFTLLGIKIDSQDLYGTIYNLLNMSTTNGVLSNKFQLYPFVSSVHAIVVPIAESLLVLFFLINLIKLLTQEGVERVSWERITLRACVFFLLDHFIRNSITYMGYVADIVQNDIFAGIVSKMSIGSTTINLGETLASVVQAQGKVDGIVYGVVFVILAIPYMATIIMILSQVFLRAVKLLLYIMFSPIPMSMAAEGETYRGKCIAYFMSFAGVCFEAVFIYVGLYIYCKGLTAMGSVSADNVVSAIINIMFLNGLFAAIISLSSQLSERIFGRG